MGARKLQGRTVDELADRFAELVLLAEKASADEAARFRIEIQDIEDELKARGPDHHADLLPLTMHPDEAVHFEAMSATFRMMAGDPDFDDGLTEQVAVATNAPFLQKTSSTRRVAGMSEDKLKKLTGGTRGSSRDQ